MDAPRIHPGFAFANAWNLTSSRHCERLPGERVHNHMINMAPGRPCRPDADLNWLWRVFLPDTPPPRCGVPQNADPAKDENPAATIDSRDASGPPPKSR
jgi:hypothetical protein